MSLNLMVFSRRFASGDISAEEFADQYIEMWSAELEANIFREDPSNVSLCASSIFILADCFNSETDRSEIDLDEEGLRKEVNGVLMKYKLL